MKPFQISAQMKGGPARTCARALQRARVSAADMCLQVCQRAFVASVCPHLASGPGAKHNFPQSAAKATQWRLT